MPPRKIAPQQIPPWVRVWVRVRVGDNLSGGNLPRGYFPGTFQFNYLFFHISRYAENFRPQVFCKKGVLRNLAKFTGKQLCQRLLFTKVAALRPAELDRWEQFSSFGTWDVVDKDFFCGSQNVLYFGIYLSNCCLSKWFYFKIYQFRNIFRSHRLDVEFFTNVTLMRMDFLLFLKKNFKIGTRRQKLLLNKWKYHNISMETSIARQASIFLIGDFCSIMICQWSVKSFANKRKQPLEVFYKKCVRKNFAKFTGKYLCQSLFFNKVAILNPVNFAKFIRTPFSQNTSVRLLLNKIISRCT